MKNKNGKELSYGGIHSRLHKILGKAPECVFCGSENYVQWASVSHKALPSLDDYIPLCGSCHNTYDKNETLKRWWRKRSILDFIHIKPYEEKVFFTTGGGS